LKNKRGLFIKGFTLLFVTLVFCLSLAWAKPLGPGSPFPNLVFKDILSREEQSYLGIAQKKQFSIKDIQGKLIVLEIFNTFCMSCPKNVPPMNNVYSLVSQDSQLKGKVTVISLAIGNTMNEVRDYKKEHKVLYPVVTDLDFSTYKALGNPRVPFTIFIKKNDKGRGIVLETHQGIFRSSDEILNKIREVLR
jgi:hypothetical protein